MKTVIWIMLVGMGGCGSAAYQSESAPPQDDAIDTDTGDGQSSFPALLDTGPRTIDRVTRHDVDEVLSQGPAAVLQRVQVDSIVSDGRFVGFRIVGFRDGYDAILGLRENDVITRVNGLPIATPAQYDAVFKRLTSATELSFAIIRDGAPKELIWPIEEGDGN